MKLYKDYQIKYIDDYDKDGDCIFKTVKTNLVICMPKEFDNRFIELDNRHYDFEFNIDIEIRFKDGEVKYIEDWNCGNTTSRDRSFGKMEYETIDKYLYQYGYVEKREIEELKITYKNMKVEIWTTTCEFCGVTFENDDDYWGCGCENCCCEVCLDCLTVTDCGRFCPDCL